MGNEKRTGAEDLSLNRVMIRMPEEAIGQRRAAGKPTRHHDLDPLAGTWSEAEASAFESSLAEQRRIDPEIWDIKAGKPSTTSKPFPQTTEEVSSAIEAAPERIHDPELPYDPADPKAVEAFWKGSRA